MCICISTKMIIHKWCLHAKWIRTRGGTISPISIACVERRKPSCRCLGMQRKAHGNRRTRLVQTVRNLYVLFYITHSRANKIMIRKMPKWSVQAGTRLCVSEFTVWRPQCKIKGIELQIGKIYSVYEIAYSGLLPM